MPDTERRRYVRVEDTVLLRYRLLTGDEEDPAEATSGEPHYRQQIQALENKLRIVLPRSRERFPDLTEALDLINMKINVLADQISEESVAGDMVVARQVSLSACGVAFPAEDKAGVDDDVWLELVLQPHMIKIECHAKVVACERNEEDERFPYLIRVEFSGLSNEDEESLIQHVIRTESHLLKQKRMQRELGDDTSE